MSVLSIHCYQSMCTQLGKVQRYHKEKTWFLKQRLSPQGSARRRHLLGDQCYQLVLTVSLAQCVGFVSIWWWCYWGFSPHHLNWSCIPYSLKLVRVTLTLEHGRERTLFVWPDCYCPHSPVHHQYHWARTPLNSLGWPRALRDILASAVQVLGLKEYATTPSMLLKKIFFKSVWLGTLHAYNTVQCVWRLRQV